MDNDNTEEITKLNTKIDEYHKEDKRRADKSQLMNLSLIAGGFALATVSAYQANPNIVNAAIPVFFLIIGVGLWSYYLRK